MGTIILETIGTDGDVFQFINIGCALKKRGHKAVLFTHACYRDIAEAAGLDFIACDTLSAYQEYLNDLDSDYSHQGMSTIFRNHVFNRITANFRSIEECIREEQAIIIHKAPDFVSALISEKLGIPSLAVFTAPHFVMSESFISMFYHLLQEDLNKARIELDMPPDSNWKRWWNSATRNIGLWPDWFTANGNQWSLDLTTVGFIVDSTSSYSLPDKARELINNEEKPVLIIGSSGTLFEKSGFYNISLKACERLKQQCILVSRQKKYIPTSLPENIHYFEQLPFCKLLPDLKAIIHHGGTGTSFQSLAYGVPQLVLPVGIEKEDNAARVADLGAGEFLLPHQWNEDTVAGALERITTSAAVKERCLQIAEKIKNENGIMNVCDIVEDILEKWKTAKNKAAITREKIYHAIPEGNKGITASSVLLESDVQSFPDTSPDTSCPDSEWDNLTDNLSQEKLELLMRMLDEGNKRLQKQDEIPRQPRPGDFNSFPLSFSQERLWFLNKMHPDSPAYNDGVAYRIRGQISIDALKQALEATVKRHEILQTVFKESGGLPFQIANSGQKCDFKVIDLQGAAKSKIAPEINRFLAEETRRIYDLSRGPLLRAALLKSGEKEYVFLLGTHHIVADGSAIALIVNEIKENYSFYAFGKKPALPELIVQYADFAVWQRARLVSKKMEDQINYWQEQLSGSPDIVSLPVDYSRPEVQNYEGAEIFFNIPKELEDALRNISREQHVTLFITLLAGFKALIHRYTNHTDILIGTPIANRSSRVLEDLIGCFINMLVMRSEVDSQISFYELLDRVKRTAVKAYENREVPFEKIVDILQLKRSLNHSPLFQIMFVFHTDLPDSQIIDGVVSEIIEIEKKISQYDLSLVLFDNKGNGLSGRFEYNSQLFAPETLLQLKEHFLILLRSLAAYPDRPVGAHPLITEPEKYKYLVEWNNTEVVYPCDCFVHNLFEKQAKNYPRRTALVFGDSKLSYKELNRKANQLAHYLKKHGVSPGVFAGICLERSFEMVIAILAIIKAGGAYVPLDPDYPEERLSYMLQDTNFPLILCLRNLKDKLPHSGAKVIYLDREDWGEIEKESDKNPCIPISGEQAIYVIYTSGSTGKPKGVINTHDGVYNRLMWMQEQYHLTKHDRVLQKTAFSFDVSVWEFFWPLMAGATLVIAKPGGQKDSSYLLRLIMKEKITTLHFVPSMLRIFLEEIGVESCTSIKRIICSGEALPYVLQEKFFTTLEAELHNLYGPTEAAIDVTFWKCRKADSGGIVPIGKPIANTQIYILDQYDNPVPPGIPGELHIGGRNLAKGYLNRPELTAEKFISNPFAANGYTRLYKTGDLARYDKEGNIEFLGRMDFQVKIRGFRIELGEIEQTLESHETVKQAVVVVKQDSAGDQRLAGYLLVHPGTDKKALPSLLRNYLRMQLPDYMVPDWFMILDSLPLNSNGKINRKQLPEPESGGHETGVDYVAPGNAEEERLAGIWSEILCRDKIGIHDNFFDIGGNSFKAIQVVRRYNPEVSVIDLFKYPTINEFAIKVSKGVGGERELLQELTGSLPENHRKACLICVPFGGGSSVTFQDLARQLPGDISLFALEIPGHDYSFKEEPLLPVKKVAVKCVEEIKRKKLNNIVLYGHCVGGALALEITCLLEKENIPVKGVLLGGTFPFARLPGKWFEFWSTLFPKTKWQSKQNMYEWLRAIGGFTDVLDKAERKFIVRNLQHDAQEAENFYTDMYKNREQVKVKAPIVSIVGGSDRLTEFYEERYLEWSYFSDSVDVKVIELAGHYFQKYQAGELSSIIADKIQQWEKEEGAEDGRQTGSSLPGQSKAAFSTTRKGKVQPSILAFFIVAFGQLISIVGTKLTSFALGIWVFQKTGAVTDFALTGLFSFLPGILLLPFAGAVADKWNRRIIMIISDTAAMLSTLMLFVLLWLDALNLWHIYAAISISSMANALQRPAYFAAVTQLIPKRYLGQANGIVQLVSSTGEMIAPVLGGVLVVMIGLNGIILIDMVTFVIALTTLLLVRFPDKLFKKLEEPIMKEIMGGWKYIMKRRCLVIMILYFIVFNLVFNMSSAVLTPLILSFASSGTLGILVSIVGGGGIIGSIIMSIWGGTKRRARGMVGFIILAGFSTFLIGLGPWTLTVGMGIFGAWISITFINTHWLAMMQTKVGMELQGRVIANNQMMAWISIPLGYFLGGKIADSVFEPFIAGGSSLAHIVTQVTGAEAGRGMGLFMMCIGVFLFFWGILGLNIRHLHYMEDYLPDAIPDSIIVKNKDQLQAEADRLYRENMQKKKIMKKIKYSI